METNKKLNEIYSLRDSGVLIVNTARKLQYVPYSALVQCVNYALDMSHTLPSKDIVTNLRFQEFNNPRLKQIPLSRVNVPEGVTPVLQIVCEPADNTQAVYSIDRLDIQNLLSIVTTQHPEECALIENIGVFAATDIRRFYNKWPEASLIFISPSELLILIQMAGYGTPVIIFESINVPALMGRMTETSLFS